ncbi:hypothetical protein KCU75_g4, partial [Aureobasidium melanogenum]
MHPKSVSKPASSTSTRLKSKGSPCRANASVKQANVSNSVLQLGPEDCSSSLHQRKACPSVGQESRSLCRAAKGQSPKATARDMVSYGTWKLTETQVCICREEGCPDWISEVGAPRQADAQKEFRVLQVRAVGDVTQHDRGANIGICLDLSQVGSLRLMEAPILHIALVNTRIVRGYSPSRSVSVTVTDPCARCHRTTFRREETNDVSKAEIPVLRLEVVDWRNKHGRN